MPGMPAGFASGPPPGGSISPSQLASQAAYTVLGNPTAAPASPIATTDPVVSGSSTAARFLASANNTAAAPSVLIEPSGNSGLYWDATNGVVASVDGADRLRVLVSGISQFVRTGTSGRSVIFTNSSGSSGIALVGGSPEGVVAADPSTLCLDFTNGRLYLKRTGTGNTGWREISPSESGTYTPTGTVITNLDSVTPFLAMYSHIKTGAAEMVIVNGAIDVDPTAPGAIAWDLSLPVPSALAAAVDLSGGCSSGGSFLGGVVGNAASDRAALSGGNTVTTSTRWQYWFAYRVL